MIAYLLSTDWMLLSQISASAQQAGISLTSVANVDDLLQRAKGEPPQSVLVDLSLPQLDVEQLVAQLRASEPPPAIIAFGPHVHEGTLQAAAEAGCDAVMPRGKFVSGAAEIMQGLAAE